MSRPARSATESVAAAPNFMSWVVENDLIVDGRRRDGLVQRRYCERGPGMTRRLVLRFAYWLLRLCGESQMTWPMLSAPLLDRAAWLVEQQARESPATDGGEVRRHRVYARLIKDFPQEPRRHLALAIERAVMALPK